MKKTIPLSITKKNAEFQILGALKTNRRKRSELGEIFIEGIESIKQALAAGVEVTRIIYRQGAALSGWGKDLLHSFPGARKIELSFPLYQELCEKQNPAELLVTARFTIGSLAGTKLSPHPYILILDRPGDKGNLGSIIRSANALKVDLIVITGHAVDILDPRVIRTSLGALFHTPVVQAASGAELEAWLVRIKQDSGLVLLGTDSGGECAFNNVPVNAPVALLMGNEAKGISRRLKNLCDHLVKIPMDGDVNSLNVACATSILLWHFSPLNSGGNLCVEQGFHA